MQRMCRGAGFSMVELLVTLSILAVLLTLAVPNFSSYLATGRLRSTADSIRTGLQLARATAIQQNITTSFWLNPSGNWLVQVGVVAPTATDAPALCLQAATGTTYIQRNCGENAQVFLSFNQALTDHALPSACPTPATTTNAVDFSSDGKRSNSSLTSIDLCTGSPPTSVRRLVINAGGAVRLCDPTQELLDDPAYCPLN